MHMSGSARGAARKGWSLPRRSPSRCGQLLGAVRRSASAPETAASGSPAGESNAFVFAAPISDGICLV
jgi:hypothetical protein